MSQRVGSVHDLFYQESMSPSLRRDFKTAGTNRDKWSSREKGREISHWEAWQCRECDL